MSDPPPIPEPLWDTVPPEAQAAVRAWLDDPGAADRRPGGAARQELHQLLQAPLLRSPLGQATAPGSRLGQEAGRAARPSPPRPPPGPARATPPGHRVQAARSAAGAATTSHGDDPEPIRHQVAEVPPVQPVVDEYRLHRLTCPRCRTSTCATLPPGVPTGAFGPRLRAILSVLAGAYRLGKRPIRQLAFDLLGLSISTGMICRLERQGAAELEAPVEELRRVRPRRRRRPTSTRPRGGRAGTRRGSGRP